MARLGFYTTRNDGGRLARRLLTRLYMRHGPSLRVAVQGLPTEQRQFLFSEIAKGRKQEAYAQAIEPKKGARAPQSK